MVIFGSLFQDVTHDEDRRTLGAHYTSEKNIMKVVKPLFLDELRQEFENVKTNVKQLEKFRNKLIDRKQVYSFDCNNPFIIENIKLWNLKPIKNMYTEIPFILENNIDMLKYWIVGLIDGDGSICLYNKILTLYILASKQIIEYLYNILPYGKMHQHKNYPNLYQLNFSNHYAVDFYKWLGQAVKIGLKRKWNIINKFIKNE